MGHKWFVFESELKFLALLFSLQFRDEYCYIRFSVMYRYSCNGFYGGGCLVWTSKQKLQGSPRFHHKEISKKLNVRLTLRKWLTRQWSFPLIQPSFVKLTQLAQFTKTSHAW